MNDIGMNHLVADVATNIIRALIMVVGGYVVAFLHRHLKDRTITAGVGIARIAVHAVEQIAAANDFSSREKLTEALDRARGIADAAGIHFSDDQWNTLIERAVSEMNALGATLAEPIFVPPSTPPPGTLVAPAGTTPPLSTVHRGESGQIALPPSYPSGSTPTPNG